MKNKPYIHTYINDISSLQKGLNHPVAQSLSILIAKLWTKVLM